MAEDFEEAFEGLGGIDDGDVKTILEGCEGDNAADYDDADVLFPCRQALEGRQRWRRLAGCLHHGNGFGSVVP